MKPGDELEQGGTRTLVIVSHGDPVIWLTLALVICYTAVYSGLAMSDAALEHFSAVWAEPILLGVVVLALARRTARVGRNDELRFWLLLTGAFGCWLTANLIPTFLDPLFESPVWAAVDGLFLASFALCFLAVEERPHLEGFRRRHPVEYAFGSLGTLLFVLACTATFFVIPFLAPGANWQSTWLLVICLDAVLALRFALLAWRCVDSSWRFRYLLFTFASLLWIVTDSLESSVQSGSIELQYGTPLDALWHAPFLAIIAASTLHWKIDGDRAGQSPAISPHRPTDSDSDTPFLLLLYAVLLPAMYLLTGATATLPAESSTARELSVLVALVAFVGLAVIRYLGLQRSAHRLQSELSVLARREQMHEAQRLESIGRLAGGVAHDLNNILQAIVSHTEIARLDSSASPTSRNHFEQIHRIAERAAWLTAQLLAFGRRQILRIENVALIPLIEQVLALLRRIVGENINLAFSSTHPDVWVRADRAQLEQIILNLVVNASDSMPAGGLISVTLSVRRLDDVDGHASRHAEIAVRDSGVGMDEETRRQAFEPFFTTKEPGKGTGLGLATVYGIVQQHGGTIEVDSAPGDGSEFRVLLPAIQPAASPQEIPETASDAHGSGTETVLVAEDDPDVRDMICDSLRSAGYTVIAAADGADAINLFRERRNTIDLLLLDAVMPRLGGREALEKIDRIVPGLPVVFSTGYDAASIGHPVLEQDRVSVLQKPYDLRDLLTTVRRSLDRGRETPVLRSSRDT